MRKRNWVAGLALIALMLGVLTGCGGSKVDVSIFALPANGIPQEVTDKLQEELTAKFGESPTIAVSGSPLFDYNKEMVEIAAGGHLIYIFGEERFKMWAAQGSLTNLDDIFDPKQYPGGVIEAQVGGDLENPVMETHLYGIPLTNSKLLKEAGFAGDAIYGFLVSRADDMSHAIDVLKALAEE